METVKVTKVEVLPFSRPQTSRIPQAGSPFGRPAWPPSQFSLVQGDKREEPDPHTICKQGYSVEKGWQVVFMVDGILFVQVEKKNMGVIYHIRVL